MNIEYAYKDGIRYWINNPLVQTGQRYTWIDNDIEYEVYPAKGEKNNHHFRSMPGVKINEERVFHKHCQYYIEDSKGLWINEYCNVQATKVLMEHEAAKFIKKLIPDYKMIPDCLFLDANDDILCIVEVNVTHKKSNDDIKKIKQYQIPTIELTYGKQKDNYQQPIRTEWLYFREEESYEIEIRKRIRSGNISIQKASLSYNKTREYIRTFSARVRPSRTIEQLTEQIEFVTNRIRFIDACIQKALV